MTIARLTAGAGYRYLTKSTACGDDRLAASTDLTAYYAASGNPPGRWYGAGLAALGGGGAVSGLRAGDTVSEEAMARLFGAGRDPVTGGPLGRAFPVFAPVAERVARRVAALPDHLAATDRVAAVTRIEAEESARRVRQPVAGFDLTFSARKSVSVLWALGDDATRQKVYDAHHRALADVIAYAEATAVFTRTGKAGIAQVPTRGVVAAAFDHWDSRTGDPQLHTHVVIANKVQGLDGAWRSLDSKALHHAAVALSELYDNLLADHLTAALPVRWGWRSRGERRSPGFEIDGLDDALLPAFSTRTTSIDTAFRDLADAFTARRGRRPTGVEVTRLRQQATLATRPVKQGRPLRELLAAWAARARTVTERPPREVTADALRARPSRRWRHDQIPPDAVDRLAVLVLDRVADRASVFTRWRIRAETERATRGLRMRSLGDRVALADRVTAAVTALAVPVAGLDPVPTVAGHTRPDGSSVFTRAGMDTYTHPELLAAETRLLTTHLEDVTAPTVPVATARRCATTPRPARTPGANAGPPVRLARDQVDAVISAATSGRRIDVLVGPAGTGKTTTLAALRWAWETTHGHGSVLGLAPSATAAHELGQALGIGCENTAKWLWETIGPGPAHRQATRDRLLAARAARMAAGDTLGARMLDAPLRALDIADRSWSFRPGQLVIVDEASLAGTRTLDQIAAQAVDSGAKLLLVGDHHQLTSVDAGGAFALLASRGAASELTSLWRFTHRWEAHATRSLRHGDPSVIDVYVDHRRLHPGPTDEVLEHAYAAWQHDTDTGLASLLIAPDTDTVAALNARAHTDRQATGAVTGPTITLGDPATGHRGQVAAGDRIVTRRNNRTLPTPGGGHVRNGDLWTITHVHPDGALTVTPTRHDHPAATGQPTGGDSRVGSVILPADYVAGHVDPGYATTAHRAQGITVATAHVLTTPAATREAVYVAMTRGRDANHLYLATDTPDPDCQHHHPDDAASSPQEILTAILARSGTATSATQAITDATDAATALPRLTAIRDTLTAVTMHGGANADGRPHALVAEIRGSVGEASVASTSRSDVTVTVDTALAVVRGLIRDRITQRTSRSRTHTSPWPPTPGTAAHAVAPVAAPSTPSTLLIHPDPDHVINR